MNSYSKLRMVQQNCREETTKSENPPKGGNNPQGEKISEDNFKANGKSPNRQNLKMIPTSGRFNSSVVMTMNLEHDIYVPREETFPIPLKYIDVTRSTHTDVDVMQEKRIDDDLNVVSNRSLSDSWNGFTKFTLLKEKPPLGCMWSGRRLTTVETTTRPVHVA